MTHQGCDHRWPRGQHDGTEHSRKRPAEARKPMGRQQTASQGDQQTQGCDALHRGLDRVSRQTQIQSAIEQHQADKKTHHGSKPGAEIKGFHPTQTRATDQQPRQEQQHHPRKFRLGRQKTGRSTRGDRDAPEEAQTLRRHRQRRTEVPRARRSPLGGVRPDTRPPDH